MLKIELIRFEAQDVITGSGVVEAPKCTCGDAVDGSTHYNCEATKHTGRYCEYMPHAE